MLRVNPQKRNCRRKTGLTLLWSEFSFQMSDDLLIKEAMAQLDFKASGTISRQELPRLLQLMGYNLPQEEILKLGE